LLPEHLTPDAPLRQYVALVDDELVGWVASIVVDAGAWCSNMFVRPEFRRRGIARAMLCRMLADDRRSGAQQAVLLASHAGAKLYPVVGYEQIGELLLFTPKVR
jgi:predicted acetyltransferase